MGELRGFGTFLRHLSGSERGPTLALIRWALALIEGPLALIWGTAGVSERFRGGGALVRENYRSLRPAIDILYHYVSFLLHIKT